jgi:hypothetical protein
MMATAVPGGGAAKEPVFKEGMQLALSAWTQEQLPDVHLSASAGEGPWRSCEEACA